MNFEEFTYNDYEWLRQVFPRTPGHAVYSDAWLYMTQACRGAGGPLGAYYRTSQFFVGLGRHRGHWVLVRPFGDVPYGFIADVADFVRSSNAHPVFFVKKASQQAKEQLVHRAHLLGARIIEGADCPWSLQSPMDDDTFPERIVSTRAAASRHLGTGRVATRFRSKLRQFDRYADRVSIVDLYATGIEPLEVMLKKHFDDDPGAAQSYTNMLQILTQTKTNDWDHFVPCVDGEPVGLYTYERLDQSSAGVYAAIASRRFTGLSERMLIRLLGNLADVDISVANLGGSETADLDHFKTKFSTTEEPRSIELFAVDLSPILN